MSSLKNVLPRRIHKERSQPESRKKFGLLEKHKDYVVRARAFHKKQDILQNLKVKASFRNPDEFAHGMIRSQTVDGVHRPLSEANKYTHEELMLMKTQDIGYKLEKLNSCLHSVDNGPSNKHIYFAEDREEAKDIRTHYAENGESAYNRGKPVPDSIQRKVAGLYRELEARKKRTNQLEKMYMEMALQQELQKKGRKRKLRENETAIPASGPVYKWRSERKR
ncbi:Probable U3 small nucleolar RNA-associated protein 11 [Linum grandiflorum]